MILKKLPLFLVISVITLFTVSSCAVNKNPLRKTIRDLQHGRLKDDTSFVYALPYEKDESHRIIQGYFGIYSHRKRAALDFRMDRGTKVCAVRDGVVIRTKEDGDRGGWNIKYRPYGNNVVIQHADGSRSGYWHLQKDGVLVNVGDTVKQGQVIALSGKTGYAATPHLHLIVWANAPGKQFQQLATRFQLKKGPAYLRAGKKYRNPG
jgi:murein DD-endopeptidase MepM/ murein hydrolase activator NlpD